MRIIIMGLVVLLRSSLRVAIAPAAAHRHDRARNPVTKKAMNQPEAPSSQPKSLAAPVMFSPMSATRANRPIWAKASSELPTTLP